MATGFPCWDVRKFQILKQEDEAFPGDLWLRLDAVFRGLISVFMGE